MSKNQVTLLCVAFFVAGLALGFSGAFVLPSEGSESMKQLEQEEQDMQKRIKEEAVADSVIEKIQQARLDLGMFSATYSKEIEDENYDLGVALDTPEKIRKKLGDKYVDGHWVFQSNAAGWWVGYKLDGVAEVDRQRLANKAGAYKLCKTTDKTDVYDGGDIVFRNVYIPKTFKW